MQQLLAASPCEGLLQGVSSNQRAITESVTSPSLSWKECLLPADAGAVMMLSTAAKGKVSVCLTCIVNTCSRVSTMRHRGDSVTLSDWPGVLHVLLCCCPLPSQNAASLPAIGPCLQLLWLLQVGCLCTTGDGICCYARVAQTVHLSKDASCLPEEMLCLLPRG